MSLRAKPAETCLTLPGAPDIVVHVRRHGRARRMSLRISQLDGRVTLTLPVGASLGTAHDFLSRKSRWAQRHLSAQPPAVIPAIGATVPVGGRPLPVTSAGGGPARLTSTAIEVDPRRPVPPQVAGLIKSRARCLLALACDRYGTALHRSAAAIALRDTRSRWGSCSSEGRLMFSWRLAMAPDEVLEYVAAHEMAHLVEMNHSSAFWAVVAQLEPSYRDRVEWLRRHGAGLHAVRFTA